jgi:hypothetical protein
MQRSADEKRLLKSREFIALTGCGCALAKAASALNGPWDIIPISFAYRFLSPRSQPEDIKHERVALLVEFRSVDPSALC